MATENNNLKENENKIENEEDKTVQNKDGKSDSKRKLNVLQKLTIFLLFIFLVCTCLYFLGVVYISILAFFSEEIFVGTSFLLKITTIFFYSTPLTCILIPLIIVIYINLKNLIIDRKNPSFYTRIFF
ncbi:MULTISPECIES: hypothetical protein [unclassified Parvimonas]|uniref:hypothetical protein n=1 Tax=unclassified Parvimonas TaxID=1151464 RepID=UPI002B47B68E|nr:MULTISPECIES: hypothetical protein [unclassified Parvimonas]MEB3024902.1 hypothetical protein [Parvimonas sp. M13]MEB3088953.1 hypothetical protein [Parvimonas sp. M20]